jgi:hypothetical protein
MDAQIVKDLVNDIINRKVEILKARGIIVVNYDELLSRLNQMGYSEEEVKPAIVKLVRNKECKAGKYADGRGWIRDYRYIDQQDDLRPK